MALIEVSMVRSKGHTRTRRPHMPISKSVAQTVDEIIRRIRAREDGYQPGDRLPAYAELAATIPTSSATLGRAMRRLRTDGWVVGLRGEATWVSENPPA